METDGFNEALSELLETMTPLELKRIIARGHMIQAEYRQRLDDLDEGLARATKLLEEQARGKGD